MSSSEDDDNYINEVEIEGDKPKITEKQRNELLKKGEDSTCKISLPDINKGNGFFCEILYNENKSNVLIIRNKIINKEILKKKKHLKISHKEKNIVILIENRILNLNDVKYNYIKIDDSEIEDFYKIEGNFNKEIENKIKKEGNKYICKILLTILGSGFFCKIPYNNNYINVLFTNNHVINENLLLPGQQIRLYYKEMLKQIEITKNRLVFTDSRYYKEGLDYTCIQIFEEDGFNTQNIFKLDDSNINNYNGIKICVLQYPKGNELKLETGYIEDLNNYEMFHNANTDLGSSGSPIVCINENYNVIGIHRRYHQKKKLNFGSYIKYILEHINYGHILCEHNIEDLNQPIQILNYYCDEKNNF